MIGVALRGLAGRKLRSALTAIAIVLGVAMVSGTYVLTDTIDKAFNEIFQESYANTDVVVSGKRRRHLRSRETQSDRAADPRERLLDEVRAAPRRRGGHRVPSSTRRTRSSSTKDGKAVNTNGAPSFGFGIDPRRAAFNPLKLVEGTWPEGDGRGRARRRRRPTSRATRSATPSRSRRSSPSRSSRSSGSRSTATSSSLGTATFTVFDLPTAQRLLDREGQFDAISVAAKDGVTPEQLQREIQADARPERDRCGPARSRRTRISSPSSSRSSSATSCSRSPASRSSSARSSSSTRSRSRSPSARASSPRCGRSAPRGGSCSARSSSSRS